MKLLFERILLEKKEDEKAIDRLKGLLGEEDATRIIMDLFKGPNGDDPKIHAFNHSKGWLQKYILGIERLIREVAQGDPKKALSFINDEDVLEVFNAYLNWVKTNRPKMGDNPENPSKQQLALDDEFMNKISFDDLQEKVDAIFDSGEYVDSDEQVPLSNDQWEVVPIDSFDQMHNMFGGHWTGDGTTEKGAGYGGNAWCHTNGDTTYNNWTSNGKKFFVVMNKNFKNIPFVHLTNVKTPEDLRDEYGTSLMAVQVDKNGNALACTLRRNHVDTPSEWADEGFGDANKIYDGIQSLTGLNLRQIVKNVMNIKALKIRRGTIEYSGGIVSDSPGFDPNRDIPKIKKIIVKDGTTTISENAFAGLTAVEEVIIPDGVIRILNNAFLGCKSLKEVSIPDSVEEIGSAIFRDCVLLNSVKWSSGCTTINPSTFRDCANLRNIILSDGLNKICSDAFAGCRDLTISLPQSVHEVSRTAFSNCSNVVVETYNKIIFKNLKQKENIDTETQGSCGFRVELIQTESDGDLEHVVYNQIPLNAEYSSGELAQIKYVTIPNHTTSIEPNAFVGCTNLVGFTDVSDVQSIETIDDNAFSGCTSLAVVPMEQMKNLFWVGENAFRDCQKLFYMEVPAEGELQEISKNMFNGCTSLQKVSCNNKVAFIRDGAFANSGVVTVDGLEKLTKIGNEAFANCVNLRVLVLKNPRFREIGRDAFAGCDSLEGIYCASDVVENYCNANNITCVRLDREGR